jgi:hypothetical protein
VGKAEHAAALGFDAHRRRIRKAHADASFKGGWQVVAAIPRQWSMVEHRKRSSDTRPSQRLCRWQTGLSQVSQMAVAGAPHA